MGVVEAGGFSGEGVAEGAGDIGGDMRCSGLGAGAGLGDELGTTMCLGLRGLSLRMTTVFSGTAATFSLEAGAGEVGALRNPITVATDRRGNPLGLTTPLAGAPLGVCPLRGLIPLTCPLDTRVMGMARSELGEGLEVEEGVAVVLAGDLWVGGVLEDVVIGLVGVLRDLVGDVSILMGMILSFTPSSGIETLQLDCLSCSLNSGRSSLNTAGTYRNRKMSPLHNIVYLKHKQF